jgi:predicted ATPase with chaperone activity
MEFFKTTANLPSSDSTSDLLHEQLAQRPTTLEDTGLEAFFVEELLTKQLLESGVLDLRQLVDRLVLSGSILESVLAHLREEGQVEVLGQSESSGALRYALTNRGRVTATEAMMRDGYVGPAPVPLKDYVERVNAQSIRNNHLTQSEVHAAFADTVISTTLLDRLGPAMHSGKAMFIYGDAGTGKSFISRRLARLLGKPILVPHAIAVKNSVIQFFDPSYHRPVETKQHSQGIQLVGGYDPRYVLCERPLVITGGELTLDMLELQFDGVTRRYRAPLQMLANNGMMLIDDLGRQRVAPVELFNRWIVPLEERHDFLALKNGQHICVPFDTLLALSTNLNPLDLADEAFLRRIGYKIHFDLPTSHEYASIWEQECVQRGLEFDPDQIDYLTREFYDRENRRMLPCHPRDLIDLAQDYSLYRDEVGISREALQWAWSNYFVSLQEH